MEELGDQCKVVFAQFVTKFGLYERASVNRSGQERFSERGEVFFTSLKVWWQDATLFVYFSYFITFIQSITFIQYIYPSPVAEASLHFLIACLLSRETPPCGAEPRTELWPALQQADALPTEPRRTIFYFDGTLFDSSCNLLQNTLTYRSTGPMYD